MQKKTTKVSYYNFFGLFYFEEYKIFYNYYYLGQNQVQHLNLSKLVSMLLVDHRIDKNI